MEDKIPLSVVILAKNETGRLHDCIEHVQWSRDGFLGVIVAVMADQCIGYCTGWEQPRAPHGHGA